MKDCLYDYQKERYSILDKYADNYYFIKNDKTGKCLIIEADGEFLSTRKALKSVFNKYDSKVMYDIQGIFGKGIEEESAAAQWEAFKKDVYLIAQEQLWNASQKQREEEAIKHGWQHIDKFESKLDQKTGNLIIQDLKSGREFSICSQEPRINFSKFDQDNLNFYAEMFVDAYNADFGDIDFAIKSADCGMTSYWRCDELFTSNAKENHSHVFTKDVCDNMIQSEIQDNPEEKFSEFINKASAELKFMEIMKIPLETNSLLGETASLGYDYMKILNRIEEKLPQYISENRENKKKEAQEYCSKVNLPVYAIQRGAVLEPENSYLIREGADWNLEAIRFNDAQLGKPMYQLEIIHNNEILSQKERIVLGTCKEQDILKIQHKDNISLFPDNKDNISFTSAKKATQKNVRNVME